jgi:two-component system nitrogen regulation sensor histidine kinase NtrY
MSRSVTPRWQSIIRDRRVQTVLTLGIVLLGPLLAVLTFIAIGPLDRGVDSPALRAVLLADLFYVLIVAALVLFRVVGMLGAKRRLLAGARLHARLTGLFALIALGPAVLVAVFAGFTINIGVEGWFSERVRQVVGASRQAGHTREFQRRLAPAPACQRPAADPARPARGVHHRFGRRDPGARRAILPLRL